MIKKLSLTIILCLFSRQALSFDVLDYLPPFIRQFFDNQEESEFTLPTIPTIEKSNVSFTKKETVKSKAFNSKLENYFVLELFEFIKRRDPLASEVMQWHHVLSQGGSREGIYRSFVYDSEFEMLTMDAKYQREEALSEVKRLFKKYLNLEYDFNDKAFSNVYFLKRFLTEKALELADQFAIKKDLSSWFAHLSVEIAGTQRSGMRKSFDLKAHYNWAEKSTNEMIKSELIIKLHTHLNKFF